MNGGGKLRPSDGDNHRLEETAYEMTSFGSRPARNTGPAGLWLISD